MKRLVACAAYACLLCGVGVAAHAEVVAGSQEDGERALLAFLRKMEGDGRKVWRKALDDFMPHGKDVVALFGAKGEKFAKRLDAERERALDIADKIAAECKQLGIAERIEFINIREENVSGRYQDLLKVLPANVPIYRAITVRKSGSGGSSTYLFVNGRWIWFRGVESMPEYLDQTEE